MTFNESQLNVVAALFARGNMGQLQPSVGEIKRAFGNEKATLNDAVEMLCQQFMENDEHYDIFLEEAKGWVKNKKLRSLETIRSVWPDYANLIEEALK